jgi:hypothetical protein
MLPTSEIWRVGSWDKETDSSPVILALTALKFWPVGGDVMAAPLQFSLYCTSEVFPVAALNFVLEFLDSFDLKVEPCRVRLRRCSRPARPLLELGAARAKEANSTVPRIVKENFMMTGAINARKEENENNKSTKADEV